MKIAVVTSIGATILFFSTTVLSANCKSELSTRIAAVERVVDSLHAEKAGQMRVVAGDGSEYTGGQVLWMKGQLRVVDRACARGDEVSAAATLISIEELLRVHRRAI